MATTSSITSQFRVEVTFYKLTKLMEENKAVFVLDDAYVYTTSNLKINTDLSPTLFEGKDENEVIKILMNDLEEFKIMNNLKNLNDFYYSQTELFITKLFKTFSTDNKFLMKIMDAIVKREKETNGFEINFPNHKYYFNNEIMTAVADSLNGLALHLIKRFDADPFMYDFQNKNSLHLLIIKGRKKDFDVSGLSSAYRYSNMMPTFHAILAHPDFKHQVHATTYLGHTAMHLACMRKDVDYMKPLIDQNARLFIQDKSGRTPLDCISLSKNEVKKIFTNYLGLRVTNDYVSDLEHRDLMTIDNTIMDQDHRFELLKEEMIAYKKEVFARRDAKIKCLIA
jgi:hypothetical protein